MSDRDLTNNLKDALDDEVVSPILLIFADFPGSPVRAWSGIGPLVWNGETWEGLGDFLQVGVTEETVDGSAQGVSVTLSGLNPDWYNPVEVKSYQGRTGELYFGLLDVSTGSVIEDPYLLWRGIMDSDEVVDAPDSVTLTIRAEHRMSDLLRPHLYRYTHEDQQALHPSGDDKGLEFIASLQDLQLKWGR